MAEEERKKKEGKNKRKEYRSYSFISYRRWILIILIGFFNIPIDLCLGNISLLEITPTKLSNFYFSTFGHLICACFRFLSLTDMIHIPWVLATWQELLLSRICVSPNPFNRNIHTNPFIKSGPTQTSVSTCIYLYIYLDTMQKIKTCFRNRKRKPSLPANLYYLCRRRMEPRKEDTDW